MLPYLTGTIFTLTRWASILGNEGDRESAMRMLKTKYVTAPDGSLITEAKLPPRRSGLRWVPNRKLAVICAVRGGLITLEDVSKRWGISIEEYRIWEKQVDAHGRDGLRVTRIKEYRHSAAA